MFFKKKRKRRAINIVEKSPKAIISDIEIIELDDGKINYQGNVYELINSENIPGYSKVYKMVNTKNDFIVTNIVPYRGYETSCATVYTKIIDTYENAMQDPRNNPVEANDKYGDFVEFIISDIIGTDVLTLKNTLISIMSTPLDLNRSYESLYRFQHTNIWMTYETYQGVCVLKIMRPKEEYKCQNLIKI